MTTHPDHRSDETGAVAIIGALFLVIALLGAALAVDIGNQIYNQRELRKVVDLAALDAIRAVGDRQGEVENAQGEPLNDQEAAVKLARDSAIANGYDLDLLDESFHVCIGAWDPDESTFAPSEQCPEDSRVRFGDPTSEPANAVGVVADDFVAFRFAGEGREISADSVASLDRVGGIAAGSRLASVSAGAAAGDEDDADDLEDLRELTDPLIEEFFDGEVDAELLSYEWLASTSVRLGDLAAEMGFGSVDEMLDAEVTGDEVFAAMIATAEADGHTEGEAQETNDEIASAIDAGWTGETSFRLGDRMEASSATAADAEWNLMDLFLGTLMLANGDNLLAVDTDDVDLDLSDLPGVDDDFISGDVTVGGLSLTVIEPAQSELGPVGIEVSTAQIRARADVTVDITVDLDLTEVHLVGTLPVVVEAARASATLHTIGCSDPSLTLGDITTDASRLWIADVGPGFESDPNHGEHSASVSLTADAGILDDLVGGIISIIPIGNETVDVEVFAEAAWGGADEDPRHFHPDFDWRNTKTVSTRSDLELDIHAEPGGSLVGAVLEPILEPLSGGILHQVIDPALESLGAGVAEADLTAWHHDCGRRTIVR